MTTSQAGFGGRYGGNGGEQTGTPATGPGGGGAGLGGAIFVANRGTVTFQGTLSLSGNTATGGAAGANVAGSAAAAAGTGFGNGIFLYAGATVVFDSNQAITANFPIDTDTTAATPNDSGVTKQNTGTVSLVGASSSYLGGTRINGGTLQASSDLNFGSASGALSLNGGTLQATGSFASARSIAMNGAGTFNIDNGVTLTLSGPISGGGAVTKSGLGTLTFTNAGANTYSGGTSFTGGLLSVNADNQLGSGNLTFNGGGLQAYGSFGTNKTATMTGAGTFDVTGANVLTMNGTISGGGALTKSNTGTLVFATSGKTYSGATTVNGGALQANLANAFSANSEVTLAAGATLNLNNQNNIIANLAGTGGTVSLGTAVLTLENGNSTSYPGVITGTGRIVKQGAGKLTLSGGSSYQGGTTINGGAISIQADNNLGTTNGLTFAGAGTLEIRLNSFTFSRTITLNAAGTFDIDAARIFTVTGLISGGSSLTKTDAGTLVLSNGGNTYSGGTVINAGTVSIGADRHLGQTGGLTFSGASTLAVTTTDFTFSRTVTLNAAGTFEIDPGRRFEISGLITGAGSLTKTDTGTLVLSNANNTYSGGTIINAGTVLIGADQHLGITNGLTFSGAGTLAVTTTDFIFSRAVALNTAGTFDIDAGRTFGISGLISGGGSLTKTNTGTLVLSNAGNNTYSGGTVINAGTVSIGKDQHLGITNGLTFSGAGTLAVTTTDFIFSRAVALNAAGTFDIDAGRTFGISGLISGIGSLTKTNAGTLVLSNAGNNTYSGGTVINAGTVSIGKDQHLGITNGLTFSGAGTLTVTTTDFTFSRTVALNAPGTFAVDPGRTFEISGLISGIGSLTKANTGTLVLSNAGNNYSGGTFINGGVVSIANNGHLGDPTGGLTFSNGTLRTTADLTITAMRMTSLAMDGTFQVMGGTTLTMTGPIAGNGALLKIDGGTLILNSNNNTYLGDTVISSGTISVGALGNLGDDAAALIFDGETLQGTGTFAISKPVQLVQDGTIQITAMNEVTILQGITGAGKNLTKTDTGTLVLTGVNTYSGTTTISGGTLSLSGAGSIAASTEVTLAAMTTFDISATTSGTTIKDLSSAAMDSVLNLGSKTLTLGTGNSKTFAGLIQGFGGAIVKNGTGTLTLSHSNTYTGGNTFNDGIVSISANDALGTSTAALLFKDGSLQATNTITIPNDANLMSNGAIDVTGGNMLTMTGVINGGGNLIKNGTGTLLLQNANTYMGATTVNDGILKAAIPNALPMNTDVTLVGTSILDINNFPVTIGSLSGPGASQVLLGSGTLTTGTKNSSTIYDGGISGPTGNLIKTGTGTFTLTAMQTYSGATTVNGGTLALSGAGSIAASSGLNLSAAAAKFNISATTAGAEIQDFSGVAGTVVDLGARTLTAGAAADTPFAGVMQGTGSFIKKGSGTLTFSAANTYSGTTTISMGTLALSGSGSIANSSAVAVNGILDTTAATGNVVVHNLSGSGEVHLGSDSLVEIATQDTSFSGVISGMGGLIKEEFGTLTLLNANLYQGATIISTGSLKVGAAAALPSTTEVILDNAPIAILDISSFDTTIGSLSGGGGRRGCKSRR